MPAATYRLQMHAGFTFDDAAAVSGYLSRLGVSHLYISPLLQAAAGSTHGYDVVDPTEVSAELGGADGHRRLYDARREHGLGELVDVVPNHMAIGGPANAWWWDVLEDGPASAYAHFFDVEWDPPESKLRNRVLLPVLGDHYGRELEAGHFALARHGGGFVVSYFDHTFPVAPRSLDRLLEAAAVLLSGEDAGDADPSSGEDLAQLARGFGHLPHATATDRASRAERQRDKESLRQDLERLCAEQPAVGRAIDVAMAAIQADPDALDELLDRQNYRLAWWRTAAEELDYRRFFDINDLIGLRVEDPDVFAATHRLIVDWLDRHVIDGVRIDHVDGLRDPAAYLDRLVAEAPGAWIVVEKILEGDERLPDEWPVAGTTGYDWLNLVGDLLVDRDGWAELERAYGEFVDADRRADEIVQRAKEEVLDGPLAADLTRLVDRLSAICERHRRYRDFTRRHLRDCLRAVVVSFSVYRTYLRAGQEASPSDVEIVESAVRQAGIGHPEIDTDLLEFLRDVLLGRIPGSDASEVALRVQQLTGPVMAKAVEDTAFYRYFPLASRNEVGGDPGNPPRGPAEFHTECGDLQQRHPLGLLALSTHDTKRSEDVRARLAVLSEIPADWDRAARRWQAHHRERRMVPMPDRNTEWLFYQTVIGAWPIDAERMGAYLLKATREAKEHTSWTDPEAVFEESLQAFVAEALADEDFVADVEQFVDGIRRHGWSNSLTQKLFTLTGPGVGDIYQGSECWDLSLVDPDNRRPVDYDRRGHLLDRAASDDLDVASTWADEAGDGASKLLTVRAALSARRDLPDCFGGGSDGGYEPFTANGPAAGHLVAFRRGRAAGGGVIGIGTRLPAGLDAGGGWADTRLCLPPGDWIDRISRRRWQGTVAVVELLGGFPVALLVAS